MKSVTSKSPEQTLDEFFLMTCACSGRYFEAKKLKKQRKKMSEQERYEHDFLTTGDKRNDEFQGAERIKFGERVDAPPMLPQLRRRKKQPAL